MSRRIALKPRMNLGLRKERIHCVKKFQHLFFAKKQVLMKQSNELETLLKKHWAGQLTKHYPYKL